MIRRREPALSGGLLLAFWAAANFSILCLLAVFAIFREQPLFWRNAGGWPLWLRDLVETSFYPLLGLELMFLLAYSSACFGLLHGRCAVGRYAILTLPLLWGLLFIVVAVVAANNLDNLLSGQPLHWHAD
jgi:hypothetical protein